MHTSNADILKYTLQNISSLLDTIYGMYLFYGSKYFYFLDFVKKYSICLKIHINKRHFAIVKIQIYGR